MDFILWLVIGGVIGWLASIIMKTNAQMGIIANVIVGCVGAWLGGWLAGRLGIATTGLMTYVVAIFGAVILIAVLRALGLFK
ncbi:MAG: GlsB/YeaQ/YmgE family stress response membrane protein [Acidobacteria bacterium]|nr:GlsB/YeaQ/YmgE family stress response membrane protein [Acidobacteriota bacterium]